MPIWSTNWLLPKMPCLQMPFVMKVSFEAVGFLFQESTGFRSDKLKPHSKPKCTCDTPHRYFALICGVVNTTNATLFLELFFVWVKKLHLLQRQKLERRAISMKATTFKILKNQKINETAFFNSITNFIFRNVKSAYGLCQNEKFIWNMWKSSV